MGSSGSGKTTLASSLASKLNLNRIELDSIYHQSNWQPIDVVDFRAQVTSQLKNEKWVVDGNYSVVRDLVLSSCDTIICLDYSRQFVMWRLWKRTWSRITNRTQLWNGNRERFWFLFSPNKEKNLLLWAWTTHKRRHQQILEIMQDSQYAELNRFRFTSAEDTEKWLANL
jgi:adenylate kinase family enzyme